MLYNPYTKLNERKTDPRTYTAPRFTRETTCFDRPPNPWLLTVQQNQELNRQTTLRRAGKL